MTHPFQLFKKGIKHDAAPGVLLMVAMVAALVVANSSGASWYGALLETIAVVGIGDWMIQKPLLLWINDGLMAVFFLFVGLELKRELIHGELSDRRKIRLPVLQPLAAFLCPRESMC